VQGLNNKKLNTDVLLADKAVVLDVLCITKHCLDENEIGYYNSENHSLVLKFCRKKQQHGGSCIYVKTNLEPSHKICLKAWIKKSTLRLV
jgi:hypothetical protein